MTATMIEAAVRALVFAVAVGMGLRLLRVNNVPIQKAAWSFVLIASFAMPFLMRWPAASNWTARMGWAVSFPVSQAAATPAPMKSAPAVPVVAPVVLATAQETREATSADTAVTAVPVTISVAKDDTSEIAASPSVSGTARSGFHWPPVARMIVMAYLVVVGALMLRLLWGLAVALRLWSTADLVSPLVVPEPNVRSSARITSPVTIGSGIVLPANYTQWDMKKLRMVVAHERSHVRQLDFYLQLLAGVYTAIFWFSPLGWWLRRTLSTLGEAIGDRAGMDAAASRSRYAEILLEFAAMPRQNLPGVAMARPGNLTRRIERLLNDHLFRSAFAEGKRRAVVSLLLIPAALFAATVLIRVQSAAAQTAPTPPTAPTAPHPAPAPAAPDDPVAPAAGAPLPGLPTPDAMPAPAPLPGVPSDAPVSEAPTPVALPVPPELDIDVAKSLYAQDASAYSQAQKAYAQAEKGYAYAFSDRGESYAIVEGPGNDVTFSGSWDDDRRDEIDAARKVAKGPFLWFTHDGKSYIVTDPATLARIRAMYKPIEDLGRKQGLLGKQQEELGQQEEDLARAQEEAGQVKMPDLSKEMADLDAAMAKAKQDRDQWNTTELTEVEAKLKAAQDQMLTPEKMAELQANFAAAQAKWNSETMADMEAKLGELQARLGALQGEAGARQGVFGSKMGALGVEQGKLGAEQGRLGAEQGRLAREADEQMRGIIQECLRNGKATTVPSVH